MKNFVFLLLSSVPLNICAATFTINDLSFDTINVNECVVYAADPYRLRGCVEIPSNVEYNGRSYTVTSIRCDAFRGSKIHRVNIPPTIKHIGAMAFCASKLTAVDIPSSVTDVGHDAFRSCSSLRMVNLSEGLRRIDSQAFSKCGKLKYIMIPSSVRILGEACFSECRNLRQVHCLGDVDSCGSGVFADCNLKYPLCTSRFLLYIPIAYRGTYVVPDGITTIPGGVLELSQYIDTIIFPKTIEVIGIEAYVCQQRWFFCSTNPPILRLTSDLYSHTNASITFVVPKGARAAYLSSPSWKGMTNIIEE